LTKFKNSFFLKTYFRENYLNFAKKIFLDAQNLETLFFGAAQKMAELPTKKNTAVYSKISR